MLHKDIETSRRMKKRFFIKCMLTFLHLSNLIKLPRCIKLLIIICYITFLLCISCDVHPNPGPEPRNNISLIHYNVQSVYKKVDLIYSELNTYDVIAISETWLNPTIKSDDLLMCGYHEPLRRDRENGYGGLMVYINNSISYQRRYDLEINQVECIWFELKPNNNTCVLIGVFYRPPNTNNDYLQCIENSIGLAIESGVENVVIMGDFNLDVNVTHKRRKIDDLCNQFSLNQLITTPTHFTETSSSVIDLIFVNNDDIVKQSNVCEPFLEQNVRYHCPVEVLLNLQTPPKSSFKRKIWYYSDGNYSEMRGEVTNFDWNSLRHADINVYETNVTRKLQNLMYKFIPSRTIHIRTNQPPWFCTEIKRKIRKRKRAYKKAKRTGLQSDWEKFKKLRNETVAFIRQKKKQYYESLSNKLINGSNSSRDWWKTLRCFISPTQKNEIPPLYDDVSSELITDDFRKAEVLNSYFVLQTKLDDGGRYPPNLPISTLNQLEFINIDRSEVLDVLKTLKLGKASGPDGINNSVLKEIKNEIAGPLCDLYNACLDKCEMPLNWKIAHVSAVYKKGDKSKPCNYRPISLLNNIEKVFEKLIFKNVFNYLRDKNFFTPLQSGFLPGDSTVNQLTYLYNNFCKALDDGLEIRIVFFDISKAFDKVWHKGLLEKLKSAGIQGRLLNFFYNYLSCRRQRVVIRGAMSNLMTVSSGVPQGSIIGPLFFLIFINDIVKNINCNINLFADDTSLYVVVKNPYEEAISLQTDIDTIYRWSQTWLVDFNPSKSESLVISRKRNKPVHPPLLMSGIQIPSVVEHKHLGVIFSNDCTWDEHIATITEKAWSRLNIMRHLRFRLNRKALEQIYMSFVRPLLEYGCVIWDNCSNTDKSKLDKIQNEAARIVTGCTKLVSLARLQLESNWETLGDRRKKQKLIMMYKMLNGLTPNYLSSLLPDDTSHSGYNLRNPANVRSIQCRTNYYQLSYLPSAIHEWNLLPPHVQNSETLSIFVRKMNMSNPVKNELYYYGNRRQQVLHTRLRTSCSALNSHLYQRNIVVSPDCIVCNLPETTKHYFMFCRRYSHIRDELSTTISHISTFCLDTLLYGDTSLSGEQNCHIFEAVHAYILRSKRFTD